ncbi:glutathione S-transferase family protein [Gloeobacter kilaueensis]|uniref:Glutathione S-transferase n=1 Tax=Gloeobacter kilaueensis (strain ATCC BAA-2537 / CCAP 1431/1 / ULC 316 / JS1) TaxID=1183438 RepID=U5QIL5_GLOK1|nr:glutathione S-transferase family protein [Gloeobacter kilaueensis]AGY58776.1 glutathione S-transferase [Gloeobacter kilaueensis JS1]
MALGMLVEGQWVNQEKDRDAQGRFNRTPTSFRRWIRADGSSEFAPEPGRYHLYVSLACPWAHRTILMRRLKGLEEVIGLSVVAAEIHDNGWEFRDEPGAIPDSVNGASALWQIYVKAKSDYTGKVTVPVLWDKWTNTIVNNESREIIRMFDTEFASLARKSLDLWPLELREQVDQTIDAIYQPINNGVYRAGFATRQTAYEEAVGELFAALDHWEGVLASRRYLCGEKLTEADLCLFTTLLRFDPVYFGHFKCNLRRIVDCPNLWNYLKDLYQQPGVRETCNLDHIKRHYYRSHTNINPTGIVPVGPILDLDSPHDRNRF